MNMKDILNQLPDGYKQACWETKAMQRKKGIQNEDTLLTLCLYYAYDKSLIDTKIYADTFLSVKISDVGFMKRFNACNKWIQWMNQQLIKERIPVCNVPEKLKEKRVKTIDASDILTKGAVKQTWHLHYAFDLFSLKTAEFHITPKSTGETLENFTLHPNDLIIADRAYATITGIEHCQNAGADYIMRLRNKAFNLYDENGKPLHLTEDILKNIGTKCQGFTVYYKSKEKELKAIRLCAVKKTDEEISVEQKKLDRKESRKQIKITEDTRISHNYFFVVTSLDEEYSNEEIMSIYRLRWQVEMVFKRFKSILKMGSMPTKTAESCETWLNCKMLIALLIEKMLLSVDFFPCQHSEKSLEGDEDLILFDFGMFFRIA